MEDEEARVRLAMTARMVARATAEMSASSTAAPTGPAVSRPSSSASIGTAELPEGSRAMMRSEPTRAAAPNPKARVIR